MTAQAPYESPDALSLAMRFHETYERLAPSFGYETRTETRAFDPATPNGRLMVAVCGELLTALAAREAAPAVSDAVRGLVGKWRADADRMSVGLGDFAGMLRDCADELEALSASPAGQESSNG